MQLDDVRPLDLPNVSAGASFVNAEKRPQIIDRAAVDVQRIRQKLADGGVPTRCIDGLRVSSLEKKCVRLGARFGVAAEKDAHVALERRRKDRKRLTLPDCRY